MSPRAVIPSPDRKGSDAIPVSLAPRWNSVRAQKKKKEARTLGIKYKKRPMLRSLQEPITPMDDLTCSTKHTEKKIVYLIFDEQTLDAIKIHFFDKHSLMDETKREFACMTEARVRCKMRRKK